MPTIQPGLNTDDLAYSDRVHIRVGDVYGISTAVVRNVGFSLDGSATSAIQASYTTTQNIGHIQNFVNAEREINFPVRLKIDITNIGMFNAVLKHSLLT